MALQTSGQISLNDIHVEAGGSSGSQASINDSDIRGLIDKGSGAQMSFSEWYGATAETVLTSAGTINGQAQRKQITVSSFISSGGTLRIPSNIWVWSDSISTAALIVNIPCTIINEGKIIGKGGTGGGRSNVGCTGGGPAISITSSGVTIQNQSGAYIAGGGAGGVGGSYSGGGGGAGGGTSGANGSSNTPGSGGALNASGTRANYQGSSNPTTGHGGGSGGGGGGVFSSGGGGGGRILPGTGGAGGVDDIPNGTFGFGGAGGSAGNAGGNGTASSQGGYNTSGGGGGWGAKGGQSLSPDSNHPNGGAAISKTTSYSLSNSGTIYGAT